MVAECKKYGLREPQFEEIGTHFRVTFYTQRNKAPDTDETNAFIIKTLKKAKDGLTTKDIATVIELSTRATRTRLSRLIDKGYIVEVASSVQDPNRQYFLAD